MPIVVDYYHCCSPSGVVVDVALPIHLIVYWMDCPSYYSSHLPLSMLSSLLCFDVSTNSLVNRSMMKTIYGLPLMSSDLFHLDVVSLPYYISEHYSYLDDKR